MILRCHFVGLLTRFKFDWRGLKWRVSEFFISHDWGALNDGVNWPPCGVRIVIGCPTHNTCNPAISNGAFFCINARAALSRDKYRLIMNEDYEADLKRRLGAETGQPRRLKYKKLAG